MSEPFFTPRRGRGETAELDPTDEEFARAVAGLLVAIEKQDLNLRSITVRVPPNSRDVKHVGTMFGDVELYEEEA